MLDVVQFSYPLILLITFLVAFTTRSILLSREAAAKESAELEQQQQTPIGPGGKSLPPSKSRPEDKDKKDENDFSKPRKALFNWLSVVVCVTFVASAADIIAHALLKRSEGWWCGQAPVVCSSDWRFVQDPS